MKIKLHFFLILMVSILAIFVVACVPDDVNDSNESKAEGTDESTPEDSDQGGNLIIGTTSGPTLFNPFYSTDTSSMTIEGFIYSGLVTVDGEFNPEGDLAKDWEFSEGGKTWTFYLREDVKWHDGEDFTADDVVFTYNIPLSEDYNGLRCYNYEDIKEVKKIDYSTVDFQLTAPSAPFIPIAMQSGILPQHILEDVPISELDENEFNTKSPIGTGPFKFDEWAEGQHIRLEAFDDYHFGRPKVDTLTTKIVPDANSLMAQLQAGDINYTSVSPENIEVAQKMEEDGIVTLQSGTSNSWEYIIWNLRNPLFQDKKVRHALTHALDKEEILESVTNGQGQVAHGPGSPANWAFNPDVPKFEYNPEQVQKLLSEAGWEMGDDGILEKNGEKFSFTIKTSQGESREKIAVVAQQQYKEIGIEVDIEVMEWSAFVEDTGPPNWNFDAQVSGMSIGSDPDPSYFWHSKEIESGLNYSAYSNQEVDELLDKNTKILEQEERAEIIGEADALVAEDQPVTFLYYPDGHLAHSTNLMGPEYSAAHSYYKIYEWHFEKD